MTGAHPAYRELFPTVGHAVPMAGGGKDTAENLVTASMPHSQGKPHGTPEQLNRTLREPGDVQNRDGLTAGFVEFASRNPDLLEDSCIAPRYRAGRNAPASL